MLTCKQFLDELSDYLDEDVDVAVRSRLEQHIQECPNCWVMCDTTKKTVQIYKGMDPYPIPPDVERYLFEPFFSTRSRGTGLGLYICRELCERYGASIDYRLRTPGDPTRNEFNVVMQRRPLDDNDASAT